MDFDVAKEVFEKSKIMFAKEIMRGKFEDLYKFDVENFKSTIPPMFNLPLIEGNVSEGVVIKPVINTNTPKGKN